MKTPPLDKVVISCVEERDALRAEISRLRDEHKGAWERVRELQAAIERLQARLVVIHDIAQTTLEPAWQALDNIRATASSALRDYEHSEIIRVVCSSAPEQKADTE